MIYSKKQKTAGGFYNIFRTTMNNGVLHQDRVCSFYDWNEVVDYFKGYVMLHGGNIEKQEFLSGKVVLSIND